MKRQAEVKKVWKRPAGEEMDGDFSWEDCDWNGDLVVIEMVTWFVI